MFTTPLAIRVSTKQGQVYWLKSALLHPIQLETKHGHEETDDFLLFTKLVG